MFNLYSLKVFSSILIPRSPFSPSESNCLVYKPHPRFLAENLRKKSAAYTQVLTVIEKDFEIKSLSCMFFIV